MKKRKYIDYLQVLPGILLVLVLIGIIFSYGVASKLIMDKQVMDYLEQASDRAAEELEKNFERQEASMQTMAHMTAHIMDFERIDTEKLVRLTANSPFDGIEYIHPNGSCYGMDEQSWDVSNKEYFKDAIKLNSGYAYDYASERSDEGCIVFYAPILSDNDDLYGILVGYYTGETIDDMLDLSFWGQSTTQYLCIPDGTIIATNSPENKNINILDVHKKCGCITEEERNNLAQLLEAKNGNFTYTHNDKKELGSISGLADGTLLFVETFPPEILSKLTGPAQNKMHIAVLGVMLSLLAYGLATFIIYRRHKKRLEDENDKVNELLKGAKGLANHDALTGLYNRRGMMEIIDSQNLQEKQRAILVLDVDKFKQVNDNYGHQVGDDVLLKVSNSLKMAFQEDAVIVRMGGDEFLIILPDFKLEQADIIKKKIRELNEKFKHPVDEFPEVSISVGVAFSRPGEKDELLIRADKALYKMKEQGRCGCCIYEEVCEE